VTERLSFLDGQCPPNCKLRRLTVPARGGIEYRSADWVDTLVIVESGVLELECRSGTRAQFAEGAMVVLAAVPLRHLRNPGRQPLVLSTLTRHR
jgi:hypothetical protein